MSTKLSVCLYTAIIDFTVFYLLTLVFIMTIYYEKVAIPKNFSSCNNTSKQTTTESTLITEGSNLDNTSNILIPSGQVGSFCQDSSDCSGLLVLPDNTTIETTTCTNNQCECNGIYSVVSFVPEYRCHIANGENYECSYDLECELNCNEKAKKCAGQGGS